MNNTEDLTDTQIETRLDQIYNDAIYHFCLMDSVVLMKFEVKLPQDIEDDQNRHFNKFIEAYSLFLARDRRASFILWRRDRSLGQQRYLCGAFLHGFCLPSLDGYCRVAGEIWGEIIDRPDAQNLIDRCMENDQGQPIKNRIRLKRGWDDNILVLDTVQLWIIDMYRRSCRVRNPKRAHLVFGASYHRY